MIKAVPATSTALVLYKLQCLVTHIFHGNIPGENTHTARYKRPLYPTARKSELFAMMINTIPPLPGRSCPVIRMVCSRSININEGKQEIIKRTAEEPSPTTCHILCLITLILYHMYEGKQEVIKKNELAVGIKYHYFHSKARGYPESNNLEK